MILIQEMTRELSRQYHREFELDPVLFMDMSLYRPYEYSEKNADAYYDRQVRLGRKYLAVMYGNEPIGAVILKDIDNNQKHCTLSISLKNDSVKNKGYGTTAEILVLEYAFGEMEMETVYADAVLKNTRSQHVLKKVGFQQIRKDDTFYYYRCSKATWQRPKIIL